MRQTLAYCVWAASAAFMLLNGGVECFTTMLVTLIGIIAGFLVLCIPDGLDGLDGMSDLSDRKK